MPEWRNSHHRPPPPSPTPTPRVTGGGDLTWLAFGSFVGSVIFVITGQEPRTDAGPVIVLTSAISGFSALLSALYYTDFTVDVLVAGGSFSFLHIEFRDFIAFLAVGNILLEAIVVGFVHGKALNLMPFFPMGMKGVFNATVVVYWSYTGFNMVATMVEDGGGWLGMAEVGGGGGSSIPA
ncbi:hypothetical protein AHAS_Ahas11G0151400 [Arachis hypogaea]